MLGTQNASHLEDFDAAKAHRRSLSIFSRKGNESPDSQYLGPLGYTSLAPMALPASRRMFRPKPSKGTILNAVPTSVPQSHGRKPSSLRKESSPLEFACTTASDEATTLNQEQERTRIRHKKNYSDDRIGVWVNGIVQWDELTRSPPVELDLHQAPGASSSRMRAQSDLNQRALKPSLSVVIPHARLADRNITALVNPCEPRTTSPRMNHSAGSSRLVSPIVSPEAFTRSRQGSKTTRSSVDAGRAPGSISHLDDQSQSPSNADSSMFKEESSTYSKRSSATSIEGVTAGRKPATGHKLCGSLSYPTVKPTITGVLDKLTHITKTYVDKPLPPVPPHANVTRPSGTPPPMDSNILDISSLPRSVKSLTAEKKDHTLHKTSILRKMASGTKLDEFDEEFMKTSPYNPGVPSEPGSPTLSEAEGDLEQSLGQLFRHISMFDTQSRAKEQTPDPNADGLSIVKSDANTDGLGIMNLDPPVVSQLVDMPEATHKDSNAPTVQPPSRVPTIPKKSRKREWRRSASTELKAAEVIQVVPTRRLSDSMTPVNDAPPSGWWSKHRLIRSASSPTLPKIHDLSHTNEPQPLSGVPSRIVIDDGLIVVHGPVVMRPQHMKAVQPAAAQEAAERVLIRILATLTSIGDLLNAVLINKGMYRVYMENQMRLIKTVSRNQSPAAWELREWCPSGVKGDVSHIEHTPSSYLRALKRDSAAIGELKRAIVAQCSSFIRKETTASMSDAKHPQAQRITDAFWRIWTFCSIFGSQKGRDEDLTGQLDWLKGGSVANNLDCAATVNIQFDFDAASILLNAPEYFGQGNGEGLTADQLYDITEIWTCMAALLQGYLGRVDQARQYGVYDKCNITEGDLETEEYMLEEWIAWILTLGPSAVLALVEHASDATATGFAFAKEKGWTVWSPPIHTASRVTFLKEPVTRLYEERVTAANAKPQNSHEQAEREKSRQRIAAHREEIRIRRQDSAFKRVPLIDMSMERPMSILSTLSGGGMLTPRFPPGQMMLPLAPPPSIHPAHRVLSPLISSMTTPPSTALDQREALRTFGGLAVDTAEVAVQRIVAMGYSEAQAKHALRITDTGDGLRVDRAVGMLLQSQSSAPLWA